MKREFRDRKGPSQSSEPFFKPSVQAKLSVGTPGDKFEQEADSVADKVVNKGGAAADVQKAEAPAEDEKMQKKPLAESISSVQKKDLNGEDKPLQKAEAPAAEEEKPMQKAEMPEKDDKEVQKAAMPEEKKEDPVQKAAMPEKEEQVQKAAEQEEDPAAPVQQKSNGTAGKTTEAKLSAAKGKGSPLSGGLKRQMESGFGTDLSNVRIHNDSQAEQLSAEMGAQAFTHGDDIYFNQGKFNPASKDGQHLIAHELTHTIQQKKKK